MYTTWPTVLKKFKKEFSQCSLCLSLQCETCKLKLVMIQLSLRTCSCKLYETWCNLMVNFGKLKQILHQSLTKKVLTLKKIYTLWYKVQWDALERVYKVTLLHPLFAVKSDKNKHQQHSLNGNFNMWYPLPRGKKHQKLSFFG